MNLINTQACGCVTTPSEQNRDKETKTDPRVIVVRKISRLALAILSAVLAPIPFAISAGIGFCSGFTYAFIKIKHNEPIPFGKERAQCGRGWFEDLTNMECPPLLSSVITSIFIGIHIVHASSVYVPFCGGMIGFYCGINVAERLLSKTWKSDLKHVGSESCPSYASG